MIPSIEWLFTTLKGSLHNLSRAEGVLQEDWVGVAGGMFWGRMLLCRVDVGK